MTKKVLGYILLRFCLFMGANIAFVKEARLPSLPALDEITLGSLFGSLFYLAWMLLFFPVLEMWLLTSAFVYGLSQPKIGLKSWSIFTLLFIAEFIMFVFLTNGEIDLWNFVKIAISIVVFLIFFRKELFKKKSTLQTTENSFN